MNDQRATLSSLSESAAELGVGSDAQDVSSNRRQAFRTVHPGSAKASLVPPNERTLQHSARAARFVRRSAVPEVAVEYEYRTGFGDDDSLIRVPTRRIGETLLRRGQKVVSAGNHSRCAVLAGEAIQ